MSGSGQLNATSSGIHEGLLSSVITNKEPAMTDIILHHYETSPYSEKVRLGFGLKGLAWASVEIPVIMPKPNLTALTGGYRKTPVCRLARTSIATAS